MSATHLNPALLQDLVRRYLCEDDESAIERLVQLTRPRLLAAAGRVGRATDAEDAVQVAYLSLTRRRGRDLDAPVFPWLLVATLRVAYRKKATQQRQEDIAAALTQSGSFAVAAPQPGGSELAALVRAKIAALPERYRDVLYLHYIAGLSHSDLAKLLAAPIDTIRTRLHRGRALLRGRLSPRLYAALCFAPWWLIDHAPTIGATSGGALMTKKTVSVTLLVLAALGAGGWVALSALNRDADEAAQTSSPLAQLSEGAESLAEHSPGAPGLTARTPPEPPAAAPVASEAEVRAKYVVEGRVVLGDKGIPFPEATVVAWCNTAEPVPGQPGSRRMKTHTWSGSADAEGRFRIVIEGAPLLGLTGFRLEDPGYRVERWTLANGTMPGFLRAAPGASYEVVLHVAATFGLRGVVLDDAGGVLAGVRVGWAVPISRIGGAINLNARHMTTSADGTFEIGDLPVKSPLPPSMSAMAHMSFLHPEFVTTRLDPWSVPEGERDHLRIVMDAGARLAGILLDTAGQPLPHVVVDMQYGDNYMLRRATRTDEDGRWHLDRLSRGKARLLARAFAHGAKARRDFEVRDDDLDMTLVAVPIPRPGEETIVRALGMQLVDVDPELRSAYELPDHVKVLILDPGPDHARLGIGRLEAGYGLSIVGETKIENVKQALELLGSAKAEGVRVVYEFANERMRGSNTQRARLTAADRTELKALVERLDERPAMEGRAVEGR